MLRLKDDCILAVPLFACFLAGGASTSQVVEDEEEEEVEVED